MQTMTRDADRKVVGIWIRVSTEDQARGESPKNHELRARYYAEAKEWVVGEVYDLSGVSGKSVMDHPEAKRMLEDVETGRITGLIFSKLARLARNTRELLDFADIFQTCDCDLISLQESIDTSTPAGVLFYTMIAAMAEWERAEIAARVAASVPIRAKLGKNTGGASSFGYRWKDGKLEPDPAEAPVRKLIFELFLETRRLKTVARMLNERGYRTRKGAKFSDTTVRRLLTDPTAKGEHRANYTTSMGRGKAAKEKPRAEWIIQPVEPVVSNEVWAECNAILAASKASRPPAKQGAYLFSGKVGCSCGGRMYVKTNTIKFACQKCRRKLPQADLEAVFKDELNRFFFSDEEIGSFLGDLETSIGDKARQIELLESEARDVRARKDQLYESYAKKELDGRQYGEHERRLNNRLCAIGGEIPKLQAEIDVAKINLMSSDQVVSEARDLYGRWATLEFEQKQYVIESLLESVTVGETEIEFSFHYVAPSPEELADNGQHKDRDSSLRSAGPGRDRRYGRWHGRR